MFCTSCGTKNIEESNYCKQCGHKLDRVTPPRISQEEFDRALPDEEQVTALLERAYQARRDGDPAEAIRLCEEALHLKQESTSAHSLLGQLYEQAGDRDRAIRQYERVLRLNPGSIADRVKLDELRGDVPSLASKKSPSQIVLVDRPTQNEGWNPRVWGGLAAGVALLLLGGILALQLRPHDTPRGNLTPLKDEANLTNPVANMARNTMPAPNAPSSSGYISPLYPTANMGYAGPPNITVNVPPSSYPRVPNNNLPPYNPGGARLPGIPDRGDNGDNRERLPSSDNGSVTLTVGDENEGGNSGGGAPKPNSPAPPANGGNSGAKPQPKVTLNQNPPAAAVSTGDSHVAMAMADDKFMKGEYRAALDSYSKAVNGAGDETAYVYRRMAQCYQNLNDKPSACSLFQRAVEEYQKQVDAGHNVEQAQIAIKACQSGIKVCSN